MDCKEKYDANGKMVLPGFIDAHVHFNLGVGENTSSDDFLKGSKKAAMGGITTFIDFLDPINDVSQLDEAFNKRYELAKKSVVDYGFHVTLGNPDGNVKELQNKSSLLGMPTIKLFTTYASTNRQTKDYYIDELLKYSKKTKTRVLVHAENNDMIREKNILVKDHEKARPALSEITEVLKLAEMARYRDGLLYIVHTNCGTTIERLKEVYSDELHSTIILESAPHYFRFNSSLYEKEDGYLYTMTPPLRSEEERLKMVNNIDAIDVIGTDHCPFSKKLKNKKYTSDIPMGIDGVKYSFLNMFTLFGESIISKFTVEPSKIHGLYPKKGTIMPGSDGDIVIFDPNKTTKIMDDNSVYNDEILKGEISATISKGKIIVSEGKFLGGQGEYLPRRLQV
ncbi:amidohydrolase family protein [Clostridium chromiireducens]|uniref:D-phenylhydantoinase n=1 Tax=Clostridium chromiireducens TaxID=225345 RepID=A0A1V4IRJ1_9CLOT|nr:amidohydrolase family protein [Clostridium chromiireducens]OPJ62087.1 D-phenylhydantoinase [Clostridium chromiireducens]